MYLYIYTERIAFYDLIRCVLLSSNYEEHERADQAIQEARIIIPILQMRKTEACWTYKAQPLHPLPPRAPCRCHKMERTLWANPGTTAPCPGRYLPPDHIPSDGESHSSLTYWGLLGPR